MLLGFTEFKNIKNDALKITALNDTLNKLR